MILFDTNVLLDIATADPVWLVWSEKEFRNAAAQGPIPINRISRSAQSATNSNGMSTIRFCSFSSAWRTTTRACPN
jgi:hypothetical protein